MNNQRDGERTPRPTESEIPEDAEAQVGKGTSYSLPRWNREHFATVLRYSQPNGRQVPCPSQALVNVSPVRASPC